MVYKKKQSYICQPLCWAAVWSLFLGLIPQVYAAEGDLELPVYNIAILIDKRVFMNGTDRNRLAQEAAKMFVDSLYEEGNGLTVSTSKVGVIAFADTAETITEMKEVNSESIEEIKRNIGSIGYYESGTHGTSLGLAVKSATEMLAAKDLATDLKSAKALDAYCTPRSLWNISPLGGLRRRYAMSRAAGISCVSIRSENA